MARPPGRAAEIRRPRSSDVAALSHFFAGLSRRTRVRRFFAPIMPTSAMLRLAGGAGEADAVIATAGGAIIGHAMAADRAGHILESAREVTPVPGPGARKTA